MGDLVSFYLRLDFHARPRLIGLSIIFSARPNFVTFAAPELLRDFGVLDSVVRGEGELAETQAQAAMPSQRAQSKAA